MMAKVCIMCQANVDGKPGAVAIREDRIITTIRTIKKKLGIAQMNQLYVCQTDLQKHSERRKSFEKSMMIATVLAGVILVIMILAIILSGRLDAWAIVSAFILAGFVIILPVFKYTPATVNMSVATKTPIGVPVQNKVVQKKQKKKVR
ncbi:Uncharacterised protein [Candidatus Bilamarchaeum dharawalense]|uniref:Uncharacterized protein n=1 Tax=Candidatus Bilamarchaeum dharawalense TaxID=2885759 RepID=A0A5E4LRP5_9ARCH|nr:Uncharacterised protein [Candidatus Bilamarchaeum dharawalense]